MKQKIEQKSNLHELATKFELLLDNNKQVEFEEKSFIDLINYFENEGDFRKAHEAINSALSKYKFSPQLHFRKAQLFIENKNEELGLISLESADFFGHPFSEVEILRARANSYLNNHELSLDLLET